MKVSIPMKAESTANKREHWGTRAERTKRERRAATMKVKTKLSEIAGPLLVVNLTRVAPHELDDDNLRGALKGFRDGVATALKVDDRCRLLRFDYGQRKGEPHEYAVEVAIAWEIPADALNLHARSV